MSVLWGKTGTVIGLLVETGLTEMQAVIRSLREWLGKDEGKECRKQLPVVESLPTVSANVAGCQNCSFHIDLGPLRKQSPLFLTAFILESRRKWTPHRCYYNEVRECTVTELGDLFLTELSSFK